MRGTSFVKSISSKLSRRSTAARIAAVAPLPEQSWFSEEVTTKVEDLKSSNYEFASSSWLVDVLDATIYTQIVAQEAINDNNSSNLCNLSKEMIDDYLEDNVELLDACNGLVEKMGMIQEYVDLLKSTVRLIDNPNVVRTQEVFKECSKLEEQCATLDKSSPKLNKLMSHKETHLMSSIVQDQEFQEAIIGSKEVASMGCHLLQKSLSFKSRQGSMKMKSKSPKTWSFSLNELLMSMNNEAENRKKNSSPWMMKELEQMVMDAKTFYDQMKFQNINIVDVESLRRSCEQVEDGIRPLEERIKELYKHLISIRMALLNILSQN